MVYDQDADRAIPGAANVVARRFPAYSSGLLDAPQRPEMAEMRRTIKAAPQFAEL